MPHVGEGQLHAFLDGALGLDHPEEAGGVEEHLRACPDCRARLAEARGLRERAREILEEAAPVRTDLPPFEELVRRAGEREGGDGSAEGLGSGGGIPGPPSGGRVRWLRRLAWAASVALAVGVGWTARDLWQRPPGVAGTVAILDSAEPAADAGMTRDRPVEGLPAGRVGDSLPEAPPTPESSPAVAGRGALRSGAAPAELRAEAEAARTDGEEGASGGRAAPAAPVEVVADAAFRPEVWIVVQEEDAARWLGGPPLRLQDAPVLDFSISVLEGERVVRGRQRLESGAVVEVYQAPGKERAPEEAGAMVEEEPAGRSAVEATVGVYRIRLVAPLAPDSLRALLSNLR